MVEKLSIQNIDLYKRIKQVSNKSKFKILELTQDTEKDITEISKKVGIAFNKCSNYCTQLEKSDLVVKTRKGKNSFVKSKLSLNKIDKLF